MKPYSGIIALLALIPFCFSTEHLNRAAKTNVYFVATDGDDRNLGNSIEQPWATLQHAVDKMQAGDTCFIRGGVYRQVIDLGGKAGLPDQPITLTCYQNETVTLSGTRQIDGPWTVDDGHVYKTTTQHDVIQLFVDGQLMTLARFPNALAFSDEVWHRKAARCQKSRESTNGHVIADANAEKSIARTGFSFDGCVALLNFGAHATATRIVENHAAGSNAFDYQPELKKYKTTLNYFFEGGVGNAERAMLDTAQEWAFDETTKTLYLWADDGKDPNRRLIESKVNTYAIIGDAATKHIVIDGLDFFAAAFSFDKSDHLLIKNCKFDNYACSKRSIGVLGPSETANFTGSSDDFCTDITVYNCQFENADASALLGSFVEQMRIENNLFSHIDYACVNNDSGRKNQFQPSSTIQINRARGLVYRRNTLSVSGNAQSFSANRYIDGPSRKFNPAKHDPTSIDNIVCEYNFHTKCGLLHTDGASMYMPDASAVESVARYNWFIGNGQRDFRWDGANRPLTGVHGNLYRNVSVGTPIKKMSPSGGNGLRIKGSYHEVYNNLGLGRGGELNVATEKGGNQQTVTRNNAASSLTDSPIPGTHSNNFGVGRKTRRLQEMLRDADNWDFRPRADAIELIDQGTPVECSVKENTIDVTADFIGKAPDIGAYEFGATSYWIPGRQQARASMPIPKPDSKTVKLDADLMYLIGLGGVKAKIYLGTKPENMTVVATQNHPQNIVKQVGENGLQAKQNYYWRVDTELSNGTVIPGDVWKFTTLSSDERPAKQDKKNPSAGDKTKLKKTQ